MLESAPTLAGEHTPSAGTDRPNRVALPLATKLVLSYLLIIAITVIVFSVAGTHLVGRLIVSEAQAAVRNDLNSARELLLGQLTHISDITRLTADKYLVRTGLLAGNLQVIADELTRTKAAEGLDLLTITDGSGRVLFRASNPTYRGDNHNHAPLIAAVQARRAAVAAVSIMSADTLRNESPLLADRAHLRFIDTPKARPRAETEESAGMALAAAAPVLNPQGDLIGILYGGVLLNKNFQIVDKIKQTVFQDVKYSGKDVGTTTIFQDDVRIATNVLNTDGSRAIGTRAAADVYAQVVGAGRPWIGRAYVVNNWYITAYEPIKDIRDETIGMLYVGVLEQKYADIRRRTVAGFLSISIVGTLVAMGASFLISKRVSATVKKLAAASAEVASGKMDARVDIRTNDELQDLANAFNTMASSLQARDQQLKDYARSKIQASERLAITGQLAAGVAHELNNPLQGIVTYAHLLLEKLPPDAPARASVQKIVNQAERCRGIVRGLLDFSRPRKPQVRPSDVNTLLRDCFGLIENQALFHNIRIVRSLQEPLPPVAVDPFQMQQVFMNLLINAAEAMDGVGEMNVVTRANPLEQTVEVEFTDTGHGIAPDDLGKIFDPFFSTKAIGHGTGLGLAISLGIVKEHQGTISVRSEIEKGATFIVTLPGTLRKDA
jgi:two-component system NtrC family sensor kinase